MLLSQYVLLSSFEGGMAECDIEKGSFTPYWSNLQRPSALKQETNGSGVTQKCFPSFQQSELYYYVMGICHSVYLIFC